MARAGRSAGTKQGDRWETPGRAPGDDTLKPLVVCRRAGGQKTARADGYTLVELVVALPIMALALALFLGATSAAKEVRQVQRQNTVVAEEARIVLERMRNEDWSELYALYNADPADDPEGAGTAPGNHFSIAGFGPPGGVEGEPVGEIIMPAFSHALLGWQLREDKKNELLGMPRDLTGDELVDTYSHAGDYTLMPIIVRVVWQGPCGERRLEVQTVMTEYQR